MRIRLACQPVRHRLRAASYRRRARPAARCTGQENIMSRRKEERHEDAAQPGRGDTVSAQGEVQSPKARMPHERDESADNQGPENPSARRMGRIAHDDVQEGHQDTSKGQELDATYHRVRQESPPEPQQKSGPAGRRR
jgi:hypothetical protein